MGSVLSRDELDAVDAYWRAANYLSVGQSYLLDNPLLRLPLLPEHIKPRLLGHWGTTPGLNFTYVRLNRAIRKGGVTEPDLQFRATTLSERIRHEA
jgi:xylulose-5-phosphate/fructose-6-phosphate phosphoketolase